MSTIPRLFEKSSSIPSGQANLNVGDILEASNGREALGMVQRFTFDLILTDIDMPVMDGPELLEAGLVAGPRARLWVVITSTPPRKGFSVEWRQGQGVHSKALYGEGPSEKIEALLLEKLEPVET